MANPKIRCPECGRELSQYHLARHLGTIACTRAKFMDTEKAKLRLPPSMEVLHNSRDEAAFWRLSVQAGFDNVSSPGCIQVTWEGDRPAFTTVVPLWIGSVVPCLYAVDPRWIDAVYLLEKFHSYPDAEMIELRNALSAELQLVRWVADSTGYRYPDKTSILRVLRRYASEAMGGTVGAS